MDLVGDGYSNVRIGVFFLARSLGSHTLTRHKHVSSYQDARLRTNNCSPDHAKYPTAS